MGICVRESGKAVARFAAAGTVCLLLANCGAANKLSSRVDPKYGVSSSPRVVEFGEPVPKGGGTYRVGKPYVVAGKTYVPEEDPNYRAEGIASWYGDAFHGRLTANGEVFDMTSLTAAHPTLPLPSYARVTNLANGKSVIVRVNDRGPYHGNRLIDVSNTAAKLLEFRDNGIGRVRVEYVGRAPLEGSDDRQLMATLRTGQPAPAPSSVRVASANAFVPDIPSSSRGVLRGDIPLPAGRPYTLGHTRDDYAAAGSSEVSASRSQRGRRAERAVQAAAEEPDETPEAGKPVASYVSVSRNGSAGLMSGRGLY
ncbi:septal ring lytic transglycosylase RlpA family protein [Afipia clevelandensis]|uniref:Endolytic peptidoglycan transglycosylase RlpA n=1 Tax=Afipia clevelandensis ATCC 49720 TaxID=883079 RepID=K8PGN3_9BRAD|nr:septal ring lytic transglycosylase RlpA family protein [Afipia clevelandensis]EKS39934.1 rare lipoprotein A [Afipia clevelandensis ATCC 49720]